MNTIESFVILNTNIITNISLYNIILGDLNYI